MAATPTNNRLKFTPLNSPFLTRPSRSPMRGRPAHDSKLSLKRVIGTTCSSPTGFDAVDSSFAYIAGGAVVVVDVDGESHTQRFYRARPTAVPLYSVATHQNNPSTPTATPKANDSRNRVAARFRDSPHNPIDWDDSPNKTWTSRERIKAATCLALSREGKYLAVGETGYAPRVLVFNLQDTSSDIPLVSISEHTFGVKAVAWSADTRYLASLGATNDGFIYVWKIDPRTGAARQFQQNRCTSFIKDMVWMGNCLITLGVRHAKMWKVEEGPTVTSSPTKQRFNSEGSSSTPAIQKTLPGRNIILGALLDATFSCAAVVNGTDLIICSETGDVCILDDDDRQMRMVKVTGLGFHITSITIKEKIAYVGGKAGNFATLDVDAILDGRASCVIESTESSHRLVALGFLSHNLVTIDSNHSIDIWSADHVPGKDDQALAHVPIPGHGEAFAGVQALEKPNEIDSSFLTWSNSGNVTFWDLNGRIKATVDVPIEQMEPESEMNTANQLTFARTTSSGKLLIAADRLGVLKVEEIGTKDCLLDTKAHSADIRHVSVFENASTFLMASSGRDRTTQLFHRTLGGRIEHFQTLEFSAKVVQVLIPSEDKVLTCSLDRSLQVHDIITRDGEPDVLAAVPSRFISLKASPTSMALGPSEKTVFVSMVDRSVCQYDLNTGRQISCFKCLDEGGIETAVLDSLSTGQWLPKDQDFLLGTSNTDKSIRLYDAQAGSFLDREWGHTEAINGVCLVDDDEGGRKVVSVGSDGTIMIWALDLNDPPPSSMSRDPSPVKDGVSGRPPLRRVLSKAEIAEFQRPSSARGRRSPPRTLPRRTSRFNLAASIKTPTALLPTSPSSSAILESTPSRRLSTDSRATSPPLSPKSKIRKRPSLPTLGLTARRKSSSSSLRGFGSLNMATEQTCRTLRAYRKKLSSAEPINQDVLSELDLELRLTATALGERAMRTTTLNETMLSGLLDQYSERLVTLLDEKLRLTYQPRERDTDSPTEEEQRSADGDTSSLSP